MTSVPATAISLYELQKQVKEFFSVSFTGPLWIIAEISEITVNSAGHCYLELIEKDKDTDRLLARARATIWSYTFRMLKPYFETTTGEALREGMKILIRVTPEFHELYGYSLQISDIDPGYTIGDLALQKARIIQQLTEEGVIGMNRELPLPPVPQKIAVISSATAAGYLDFIHQLGNNSGGYKFHTRLFDSPMQGSEAEEGIIRALKRIYVYEHFFDAVVIIRGGGATADLGCFNNYRLAYHVTQFPLPVITGIGHEKDETVLDRVAHTSLKTPTAVAEFMIDRLDDFTRNLIHLTGQIRQTLDQRLGEQKQRIGGISMRLLHLLKRSFYQQSARLARMTFRQADSVRSYIRIKQNRLAQWQVSLRESSSRFLSKESRQVMLLNQKNRLLALRLLRDENHRLGILHTRTMYLDPVRILKRGFSITSLAGKSISDSSTIQEGQIIETQLYKGNLRSRVIE